MPAPGNQHALAVRPGRPNDDPTASPLRPDQGSRPDGRLMLGLRPRLLLADASWASAQLLTCRAQSDGTLEPLESEQGNQFEMALTDWLLRRAGPVGRLLPAPVRTPPAPLPVAVAVPLHRLAAPGALRELEDVVAMEHVDPSQLAIAVAETDLANAEEDARGALEDLVSAGFAFELVGYTGAAVSSGHLPESGVAAVVLHPRLRQDRLTAAARAAAVMTGDRALVVASGVGGQWRWLAAGGCDAVEGPLFSFPEGHDPLALQAQAGVTPCLHEPAPDRVIADALRALMHTERPGEVPAILREAVGRLGGRVVPGPRRGDLLDLLPSAVADQVPRHLDEMVAECTGYLIDALAAASSSTIPPSSPSTSTGSASCGRARGVHPDVLAKLGPTAHGARRRPGRRADGTHGPPDRRR